MKKLFHLKQQVQSGLVQGHEPRATTLKLMATMAILCAAIGLATRVDAQNGSRVLSVTSVSSQEFSSGTLVSIAADGPMNQARHWQDSSGYHVVLANAVTQPSAVSSPGISIHRVDHSVEVLVQTKPGASVSFQPVGNRVNLTVGGSLVTGGNEPETTGDTREPAAPFASHTRTPSASGESQSEPGLVSEEEGLFVSVFSFSRVLILLGLGILGLLIYKRFRSRPEWGGAIFDTEQVIADQRVGDLDQAASNIRTEDQTPVGAPDWLFGAYRIDQEVGKLVLGQPYRVDVLSSRAPADRRAIEAALIRIIGSTQDQNERLRACSAFEKYGFVARECAALLMAPDPFDRTSAAQSLGKIKSTDSLPYLLEGLYDSESIVRNQVVVSIGELALPRAIGALLDLARRHPDVPGTLVRNALNSCSVAASDVSDVPNLEMLDAGSASAQGIHALEPASAVLDLPEDLDDEELAQALARVRSSELAERLEATKNLAGFQVRRAVAALTTAARHDSEPSVRAQAISSLASINHESVFPAVLISMADETREVRASAARSLSHLSFDRADAYIRVIETTDEETLLDVARACIKAGIVAQGIERLASNDHRQAYEAFSVLSLIAKAGIIEPIIEAVINNESLGVRLTAVRVLANTRQQEVFEQMREVALKRGLGEEIRTALLDEMYKWDQMQVQNQNETTSAQTREFFCEPSSTLEVETAIGSSISNESQAEELES